MSSGTQIQSFNPSSFISNDGLCGAPLTDACAGDYASQSLSGNANEDDDEWIEMMWFYPSMPLGSVVGFWSVLFQSYPNFPFVTINFGCSDKSNMEFSLLKNTKK